MGRRGDGCGADSRVGPATSAEVFGDASSTYRRLRPHASATLRLYSTASLTRPAVRHAKLDVHVGLVGGRNRVVCADACGEVVDEVDEGIPNLGDVATELGLSAPQPSPAPPHPECRSRR